MTKFADAAKYLDKQMVEPLRQMIVGRKLFARTVQLPKGSFSVDYDKITEMSAAEIIMGLPSGEIQRDMIKVLTTNLKLPCIFKGYTIPRDMLEAFQKNAQPIDGEAMLSAMHVVAMAEDDLLIQGWAPDGTNYVLSGLYQSANNDYTTSKDFGTNGNAIIAVAGAFALLKADNIFGVNFNLALNPTQFEELSASVNTTGVPEWAQVLAMLNRVPGAPPGNILETADLVAGTGMMSPVDPSGRLIDLVIGVDARNILGEDSKLPEISPVYGTVIEALVPRIKQTNAICKLSAI